MRARSFAILLLLLLSTDLALGWTRPALIQRSQAASCRAPSHLSAWSDDSSHAGEQSRRQWLFSLASNAAAATLLPSIAGAAAPKLISSAATCDPTVSIFQRGDRLLYLLGTAHISEVSANLAAQLVQDTHPNAVLIELDLKRVGGIAKASAPSSSITTSRLDLGEDPDPSKPSKLLVPAISNVDAVDAIAVDTSADSGGQANEPARLTRPGGPFLGFGLGTKAVGGAIRGMYQSLGKAGFQPGEEFVAAVREGRKIGADIVLGDRDVEVTLNRLTQALARTDLNQLLNPNSEVEQSMRELMGNPEQPPGLPSDDPAAFKQSMTAFVETIKQRDKVRQIMGQLQKIAPELVQVMLTERDAYMAAGLDTLNQYAVITAVMGLAHLDGVEANLKTNGWKQVRPRCKK